MNALLDTDVLIDHLRGEAAARSLLLDLAAAEQPPAISVITVAGIEAGLRAAERPQVEALLSSLQTLSVDAAIARQAGRYRMTFGQSHGVLLPDALIAATALQHEKTLYTLNRKHYPMADLEVIVPYQKTKQSSKL